METGQRIRVGVLEDQQVFRECIVTLLEQAGMEVVAYGSDVEGFMGRVHEATPDVVLVDLKLDRPGLGEVMEGLRVLELLRDFYPRVRALVLSGNRDPALVQRCFEAGAAGYLCKLNVSTGAVVEAVERVARGERLVPMELCPQPVEASGEERALRLGLSRLTSREREVLGYIAAGADNLKIAACLNITERTVKAHITNIYRKLGPENRTQMAMLACQLGIERPALL
jgi:DNA-binding NarL/FixJ family response regulator